MKKIFALALAAAMVLSLASVAFAASDLYSVDYIGGSYYKTVSKQTYLDSVGNKAVSYGNTIYYPLMGATYAGKDDTSPDAYWVTEYDAVKGLKISTDWSVGSDWVSKVEIVKKRWGSPSNTPVLTDVSKPYGAYYYFLAITFKASPNKAESSDVIGEITLKKSSGDNKVNRLADFGADAGETPKAKIDITLGFTSITDASGNVVNAEITKDSKKFLFDGNDEDEEWEFTFEKWPDALFTVNTYGQGDIVLKAITDYNADIGALYPEANLDFFIGNGAVFNKTGEMFIPADEGSFIYEIKNGALVAIKGAEYDEYDEGFYFKTRTLGQFVVSDIELDLSSAAVVTPTEPGAISVVEPSTTPSVVVNPTTGAAV